MNVIESTQYRKHLADGGVPPEQAVAHADALGAVLENLPTKEWVIAEIDRQLQAQKFDLIKWMVGLFLTLFVAQTGVTVGAVVAVIRYLPH